MMAPATRATIAGIVKPVQIAYHVPDPEADALRCAKEFGWGPFFLFEHIPLQQCHYRGRAAAFDHTSAYGQAGDIMVELISQSDDSPSVLRDLFKSDQRGIHHVAHFVPDLPTALASFQSDGTAVAMDAVTTHGVRFAMVDTSKSLGHMLELYEPVTALTRFYAYVRRAAEEWDGTDPVRRIATK